MKLEKDIGQMSVYEKGRLLEKLDITVDNSLEFIEMLLISTNNAFDKIRLLSEISKKTDDIPDEQQYKITRQFLANLDAEKKSYNIFSFYNAMPKQSKSDANIVETLLATSNSSFYDTSRLYKELPIELKGNLNIIKLIAKTIKKIYDSSIIDEFAKHLSVDEFAPICADIICGLEINDKITTLRYLPATVLSSEKFAYLVWNNIKSSKWPQYNAFLWMKLPNGNPLKSDINYYNEIKDYNFRFHFFGDYMPAVNTVSIFSNSPDSLKNNVNILSDLISSQNKYLGFNIFDYLNTVHDDTRKTIFQKLEDGLMLADHQILNVMRDVDIATINKYPIIFLNIAKRSSHITECLVEFLNKKDYDDFAKSVFNDIILNFSGNNFKYFLKNLSNEYHLDNYDRLLEKLGDNSEELCILATKISDTPLFEQNYQILYDRIKSQKNPEYASFISSLSESQFVKIFTKDLNSFLANIGTLNKEFDLAIVPRIANLTDEAANKIFQGKGYLKNIIQALFYSNSDFMSKTAGVLYQYIYNNSSNPDEAWLVFEKLDKIFTSTRITENEKIITAFKIVYPESKLVGYINSNSSKVLVTFKDKPQAIYDLFLSDLVAIDNANKLQKNIADKENRARASVKFEFKKGDFCKGIGSSATIFEDLLKNGFRAKEFFTGALETDVTPFDTDLARLTSDKAWTNYGTIGLKLKNNGNISITRDDVGEHPYKEGTLELFRTGGLDHYGIRVGFSAIQVEFFYTDDRMLVPKLEVEIAKNGFYIPICDTKGELLFSPQDYDLIRSKMQGLSYYGEMNYTLSPNLYFNGIDSLKREIIENMQIVNAERQIIIDSLNQSLSTIGKELHSTYRGLETGLFLLDTGSTSRGVSVPNTERDYDMILYVDADYYKSEVAREKVNSAVSRAIGKPFDSSIRHGSNNTVRFGNVDIALDLSVMPKKDKFDFSTNMAVTERLISIYKQHPEQYDDVIANIVKAKQVFKAGGRDDLNRVYKKADGGFGGVGIENWILQNGGSFVDAAQSFLDCAKGKTLIEFQTAYPIYDFGKNHKADPGQWEHDNFIEKLSLQGFEKMKINLQVALQELLIIPKEITPQMLI